MDAQIQALIDEVKAKAIAHSKSFALECVELLPAALEIAAKQTATPIDDVVLAALKEPAKAALKGLIEKV